MSKMSFVQACNAGLRQELQRDPSVFLMGEDIAHYGGMFRVTEGLLETFGENRVIDTPISESGFMGMALGAALAGKRPVAELMFIDFGLVA
ncbi:MAG: alpha-ketoacid dehydrogenase subunit beta, partial [Armatimonadetes bacterium Cent15-Ar3]